MLLTVLDQTHPRASRTAPKTRFLILTLKKIAQREHVRATRAAPPPAFGHEHGTLVRVRLQCQKRRVLEGEQDPKVYVAAGVCARKERPHVHSHVQICDACVRVL